jgi:hypothetical protein
MSNFDIFQNSGYINKRNRKRTLIVDVSDSDAENHLGGGTEFKVDLFEPLVIDKHSEVYLDNFLSFNSNIGQTPATSAFLLKINEFNMNSNVASSADNGTIFNSLIIPNEHKSVTNNHSAVIHKGKKFNYVCDINPQKIHSISGKVTDLSGNPIFHGIQAGDTFTYALTGITSGKINILIESGKTFTGIIGGAAGTQLNPAISGTFLATHLTTATTLHFSTNRKITDLEKTTHFEKNTGDIVFTLPVVPGVPGVPVVPITITNPNLAPPAGPVNPNLHLVNEAGRFIAEFSIVSRE